MSRSMSSRSRWYYLENLKNYSAEFDWDYGTKDINEKLKKLHKTEEGNAYEKTQRPTNVRDQIEQADLGNLRDNQR